MNRNAEQNPAIYLTPIKHYTPPVESHPDYADAIKEAKADVLEEACEMFHPSSGYGGANVHQRLRTRARDYRGNR